MFSAAKNRRSTFQTATSGCFVLVLLLIYFVGTIEFNSIHSLLHASESTELHSEENEKEACHKAIYHNAREGCDHKVHITTNEKCSLCHLIVQTEQSLPDPSIEIVQSINAPVTFSFYQIIPFELSNYRPARAPPAV